MSKPLSREEVVTLIADGTLTIEEGMAALAELDSANEGKLTCKTSYKGSLSIYGLQRQPVTLYPPQWERILAHADEIRAHIKADAPQYHPAKPKAGDEPAKVARIVRLSRKGEAADAHVLVDQPESEAGKAEMARLGFTLSADGKVIVKPKAAANA